MEKLSVRENPCIHIRQRWVFTVLCLFGTIHMYALRGCLPITMTEMVIVKKTEVFLDDTCPSNTQLTNTTVSSGYSGKKFGWSEHTQGVILGSFYYGYIITNILGGMLAVKFGGKRTIGFGLFVASFCTLILPLGVTYGDYLALIILRILMGLGEGMVNPALNTMLSQWAPPEERSRTGTLVYSGEIIGTIYSDLAGGALLHYSGNWSNVFYLIGGTGMVWFMFWVLLCYNTPREHPFISQKEANFLEDKISQERHEDPGPVPWLHVLKSGPYWAAEIALISSDWSLLTILNYLPKYMKSVLKFSIGTNGYTNSVISVCMLIGSLSSSWLADLAIGMKLVPRTTARKIGVFLSLIGSASLVVVASYVGCGQTLVTVMFAIAMTMHSISYSCIIIFTLDLSPNYCGTLMAMSIAISCGGSGSLSTYVISRLTPNQTLSEWRIVFWLLFVFSSIATGIYLYLGSGDVQYWNDPKNLKDVGLKAHDEVVVNIKDSETVSLNTEG